MWTKAIKAAPLASLILIASCAPRANGDSYCLIARPIYPPANERAILVERAPVTARAVAGHNGAYERVCRAGVDVNAIWRR